MMELVTGRAQLQWYRDVGVARRLWFSIASMEISGLPHSSTLDAPDCDDPREVQDHLCNIAS